MNEPKKRIVSLVIVLVIGSGLVCLASRSNDPNAPSAESTQQTAVSFLSDPDTARQPNPTLSSGELFFKMMLAVVLVGVLAIATMYVSKRVLPRITNAPGKEIRILETAYLGPRKAIHLVEVRNQKLLIGSTAESISMLSHIEEGWLDTPDSETNNAASL